MGFTARMTTNTNTSTKYAIKDNTGGWMIASDELPNTHYTPEIEDAQLFDTEAEAAARMAEFYATGHSIIEVAVRE